MKKITIFFWALFAFSALQLNAQTDTDLSKWSVGVFPSIVQYQNTNGTEFFKIKESSFAVDVGAGYRLNSSLLLEGHLMGGGLDFAPADSTEAGLDVDLFALNAQLQYKFNNGYILREDFPVSPFVFAGAGLVRSSEGTGAGIPLGGGINFRFDEQFSMQWRTGYNLTTRDAYNYVQHSLGFVWHLDGAGQKEAADTAPVDSDGDGIADAFDKCPDVAGIEANHGCPEIDQETQEVLAIALKGIQFETAKDVLKSESYPALDRVVYIMNKHPEYDLAIDGHTDSQGDDAMNLDLSKRRAKRAMDYLISKGINKDRLSSEGFGETRPVADNGTSEGRAQNRRVEFRIVF